MKPGTILYRACPRCRGSLVYESGDTATLPGEHEYACLACGYTVSYEIRDGRLVPFDPVDARDRRK